MLSFSSATSAILFAASTLHEAKEIIDHRVLTPTPPSWLLRDPVSLSYLLSLTPSERKSCEDHGLRSFLLSTTSPPARLARLARASDKVHKSFPLLASPFAPPRRSLRVTPRKHTQIHAVAAAVASTVAHDPRPIRTVVDIGGGHGHLAGLLVDALNGVPTMVVEKDAALVETGRALNISRKSEVLFSCCDVFSGDNYARAGDFVVALHACGAVGDRVVMDAAKESGASGLLLVTCCLQKLFGAEVRTPLSKAAASTGEESILGATSRTTLGLTNRSRAPGFSDGDLRSRVTRLALQGLLARRGLTLSAKDAVHGVSRHRMKRGLQEVADDVLALHGLTAASKEEIVECERCARADYEQMRLLSLPRNMMGELLELAVVLDRAACLEESGRFSVVKTCRLFDESVSPRNLAIIAY